MADLGTDAALWQSWELKKGPFIMKQEGMEMNWITSENGK